MDNITSTLSAISVESEKSMGETWLVLAGDFNFVDQDEVPYETRPTVSIRMHPAGGNRKNQKIWTDASNHRIEIVQHQPTHFALHTGRLYRIDRTFFGVNPVHLTMHNLDSYLADQPDRLHIQGIFDHAALISIVSVRPCIDPRTQPIASWVTNSFQF